MAFLSREFSSRLNSLLPFWGGCFCFGGILLNTRFYLINIGLDSWHKFQCSLNKRNFQIMDVIYPFQNKNWSKKERGGEKYQKKEGILAQYRRAFGSLNGFMALSSGDQHRDRQQAFRARGGQEKYGKPHPSPCASRFQREQKGK